MTDRKDHKTKSDADMRRHQLLTDRLRVLGTIAISLTLIGGAVVCALIGEPGLGGALVASSAIAAIMRAGHRPS